MNVEIAEFLLIIVRSAVAIYELGMPWIPGQRKKHGEGKSALIGQIRTYSKLSRSARLFQTSFSKPSILRDAMLQVRCTASPQRPCETFGTIGQ